MNNVNFRNLDTPEFQVDEAYKRLATNISFCGEEIKVVAVTSCTPNEGKTEVSFHLARALAESGYNVIFIDADIRKSVLTTRYQPDCQVKGLTHLLAGRESFENVFYKTNLGSLYMIFAGPPAPNPMELLGSRRFSQLLKTMRKSYDYVIIDCPPLGTVIDAAVIAKSCDGTVMVFENNKVSRKLGKKVKQQLELSGSKLLGAVLNKIQTNTKDYYGDYGRY